MISHAIKVMVWDHLTCELLLNVNQTNAMGPNPYEIENCVG